MPQSADRDLPKLGSLKNMPRPQWEKLVLDTLGDAIEPTYAKLAPAGLSTNSSTSRGGNRVDTFLNRLTDFDKRIYGGSSGFDFGVFGQKNAWLQSEVRKVRMDRAPDYQFVADVVYQQQETTESFDDFARVSRLFGAHAFHLMVGESNRQIVGTKNGIHWKKVEFSGLQDGEVLRFNLFYFSKSYLSVAYLMDKDKLDLVPSKVLPFQMLDKIDLPNPRASNLELLADAYSNKQYDIPSEGVEVSVQRGGDAKSVLLMESDAFVHGKVRTQFGDGLVTLNKATGEWIDPLISASEYNEHSPWTNLVASVYRAFVVKEGIVPQEPVSLAPPRTITLRPLEEREHNPYVIWIPRKKYEKAKDPRAKLEGERRKPRRHQVTKSYPAVPMSKKHEAELRKWAEETGNAIPDDIPEGHTFRRPHKRGSDSGSIIVPEYVLRAEKIQEERRKALNTQEHLD